jgi:hypothetical protein
LAPVALEKINPAFSASATSLEERIRLPREEVAEMLMRLSGKSPPATVVKTSRTKPKVNPFFVEEVFLHLKEENRLYDSKGVFALN